MGALSQILQCGAEEWDRTDKRLTWWCPGCDCAHTIQVGEGAGPRWSWNGNAEKPTFTPSVLVTGRDFTEAGEAAFEAWHAAGCPSPAPTFESADTRCHSFVVDGQMQMLTDCTHAMAGQTVPIQPWPLPSCSDGEPAP